MHTAGSLQGGRWVWVLAKVKESFELFGGDKVDSYLLFSTHTYMVVVLRLDLLQQELFVTTHLIYL